MGFESSNGKDRSLELQRENLNRLKALMGDEYDEIEMQDYLSYLRPEVAKIEIDDLEQRLAGNSAFSYDILKGFREHLRELAEK